MGRVVFLSALAMLSGLVVAFPSSGASSSEFKARFHDDDCTTHAQCGRGLVEGYGHVRATIAA